MRAPDQARAALGRALDGDLEDTRRRLSRDKTKKGGDRMNEPTRRTPADRKRTGGAWSDLSSRKATPVPAALGTAGSVAASRARLMRGQESARPVAPVAAGAAAAGQLLRDLRRAAGLSERSLARRSAVARSTVTRLEHGELRPRRSLLQALAVGLDPDRSKELAVQLAEAAAADLVPESDRWRRYRRHRLERGILRGDVPLPSKVDRGIRLHRAADAAWAQGMAVLHRPGALDDAAALDQANALLERSRALRDQAGPAMTLYIGKARIPVGWRVP